MIDEKYMLKLAEYIGEKIIYSIHDNEMVIYYDV